jgi:hypothetical protein
MRKTGERAMDNLQRCDTFDRIGESNFGTTGKWWHLIRGPIRTCSGRAMGCEVWRRSFSCEGGDRLPHSKTFEEKFRIMRDANETERKFE